MSEVIAKPEFPVRGIVLLLCSAALFGLGWHQHLGGSTLDTSAFIYGDKGDGFFNLWVLGHLRLHAPITLRETGIFWPQQGQALLLV